MCIRVVSSKCLHALNFIFDPKRGNLHRASSLTVHRRRISDTWMTPQQHYRGMLCFSVWRRSHHLLQLYQILLQQSSPLRLQKCFVDSNTSPTPPSVKWWGDKECIFLFLWNIPFHKCPVFVMLWIEQCRWYSLCMRTLGDCRLYFLHANPFTS